MEIDYAVKRHRLYVAIHQRRLDLQLDIGMTGDEILQLRKAMTCDNDRLKPTTAFPRLLDRCDDLRKGIRLAPLLGKRVDQDCHLVIHLSPSPKHRLVSCGEVGLVEIALEGC